MAWIIGDSFDFYTTNADGVGLWDSSTGFALGTGRFSGSQAMQFGSLGSTGVLLIKASGSNDATHHIVCAFNQAVGQSGTTLGTYFQLLDGTTGQCCVVFRSDGAILLTSGTPGGTILATYTGLLGSATLWTALEFEITIHPSAGVFKIRKNGNTSDDFSATSLVTRVSANSYANKLQVGASSLGSPLNTANAQKLDDILWFSTSGSAPNTWVGDIRVAQLMPVSDSSIQFSKSPNPSSVTPYVAGATTSRASGLGMMAAFTASYTGTISSAILQVTTGGTGNLKCAIYDSAKAAVLATSNAVVNPVAGPNTITFGTPLSVTKGTVYYLAADTDFTIVYTTTSGTLGFIFATAYASFPAAGPAAGTSSAALVFTISIVPTINAEFVSDTSQDGTTSYVYDSTVGHTDLYDMADLPTNTATIVGIQTRAFMEKSDTGARTGRIQLKSGGTTSTHDLALSSSFVWNSMVDVVDPNTSAAWTLSNANAAQLGLVVQA